jgi:hypothetical protein
VSDGGPKQEATTSEGYPPHMPRGAWLWPEDRTGMEWATEHDERL